MREIKNMIDIKGIARPERIDKFNIVYFSLTGNTQNFIKKFKDYKDYVVEEHIYKKCPPHYYPIDIDFIDISDDCYQEVDSPYILIAPTYEPEVTYIANEFIETNDINLLRGFIGGGNKNFAEDYIYTAKNLANKYDKPVLMDFEFSGNDEDIENLLHLIPEIA